MDRQTLENRLAELKAELEKSIVNQHTLRGAVLAIEELLSKWGIGDSDKKGQDEPIKSKPSPTKRRSA